MLCQTCACNLNNQDVIDSLTKQGFDVTKALISNTGATQVQDCADYNANFKIGNMISQVGWL